MQEKKWKKIGKIYSINNKNENLLSHASNPLAVHLRDDIYRIFYSGRDKDNKSSVSYVDYNILERCIIKDYKKPIVVPKKDSFYSHGITIGNCWLEGEDQYIGFMGWQQEEGEHWRGDIGKFNVRTRNIEMLLGVNQEDKISLSYPHILYDDGLYKMWYGSTIDWTSSNGEMIHTIKYAESKDCKNWNFMGTCIPYEIGKAQAFSKPCVIKNESGYQMWFSYRGGNGIPYRIGYAFSEDGYSWNMQQSNLTVSNTGWDSEMVCYPFVFVHKKKLYMLYNGNRYGLQGFGLAVLEED